MQMVSFGENLHEMSKPIFWEKKRENYCPFVICIKCQSLFSGKIMGQFAVCWFNPESDSLFDIECKWKSC